MTAGFYREHGTSRQDDRLADLTSWYDGIGETKERSVTVVVI